MKTAGDILNGAKIQIKNLRGGNQYTTCPQCSHLRKKKKDLCLSVLVDDQGVQWRCHHCNWRAGKFYRGQTSPRYGRSSRHLPPPLKPSGPDERTPGALNYWREAGPWQGTLAERYFLEQRKLDIRSLDLSHCLRWHAGERALIWLMTDAVTGEPIGVHRAYLDADGAKIGRWQKGPRGIIRLSRDDSVTLGLGTSEGARDAADQRSGQCDQ